MDKPSISHTTSGVRAVSTNVPTTDAKDCSDAVNVNQQAAVKGEFLYFRELRMPR